MFAGNVCYVLFWDLFTNTYFNLSGSEFSLFKEYLTLVGVCGKPGLYFLGTPAHEGAQQRQGGDSSNISPEAGCHGKLLTELSDTSSSW